MIDRRRFLSTIAGAAAAAAVPLPELVSMPAAAPPERLPPGLFGFKVGDIICAGGLTLRIAAVYPEGRTIADLEPIDFVKPQSSAAPYSTAQSIDTRPDAGLARSQRLF
jgi:hypothetical protein